MPTVLAGLAGGLVATIVMAIVMMVAGDDDPPPAMLLAKVAGGEPGEYEMPGMVLHLLYGTVAGVVFALGVPAVGLGFDTLLVATGLGIVWGIVLLIIGMVFWMKAVIGADADREMMMRFVVLHLLYGVVLGAFLGTGLLA